MASLYITALPPNALRAVKALREALRYFDPESNTSAAQEAYEVFKSDGFVHAGDIDTSSADNELTLTRLRAALRSQGAETALDIDPERYARQARSRRLTAAGATPEQVFAAEAPGAGRVEQDEVESTVFSTQAYETALALMALMDGNPLRAAAGAAMLGRTAEDEELYREVILALVQTFPWLADEVVRQGLIQP